MPIRRPTPIREVYRWHRAALAGLMPTTHEDEPQAGWFRMRYVKGGPWIPARIWLEQPVDSSGELTAPETLRAEVLGQPADPVRVWMSCARRPITREAFMALVAEHASNPRMAATHVPYTSEGATRP